MSEKNEFDWLMEENDCIVSAEFGITFGADACISLTVDEGFIILTVADLEKIIKQLKDE